MKYLYLIILITLLGVDCLSQETYTGKKGSRLFPGHLHIVIEVDSSTVKYELFNHWYSWSYVQYRQLTIPLDRLDDFNSNNDSLQIKILDNKVKLIDKRYKLNRKIKHQKICALPSTMRKISYACELTKEHPELRHFELYEREELSLPENEFKRLIKERLAEKIE